MLATTDRRLRSLSGATWPRVHLSILNFSKISDELAERLMTQLRIDPWESDRGFSYDVVEETEGPAPNVQVGVETDNWSPIQTAPDGSELTCVFIDGVRRIDAHLFAESDESTSPALAGSWAIGSVTTGREAEIGSVFVGRNLFVGGGISADDLAIEIGGERLVYQYETIAGHTPVEVIQGLQNTMRRAEAELASVVIRRGGPHLVFLDGPLTYFGSSEPVVGLIKRQSRAYLGAEHAQLLWRLKPGDRTPIFAITGQQLERYSWYTRVAPGRRIDGRITGIVRMEITTALPVSEAADVASTATSILPRFAPDASRDPRAPQNVMPIGKLESILHNRLGDRYLIRRAIEQSLWSAYA